MKTLQEFVAHPVRFAPFCFRTDRFPPCDFDDPEAVKALIGAYRISCTFYNRDGNPVTSADSPERYAAVVEIHRSGGMTSKRFLTLCRLADEGPAVAGTALTEHFSLPVDSSIDPGLIAARRDDFITFTRRVTPGLPAVRLAAQMEASEAVCAVNLQELTALQSAGKPLPTESIVHLERQWWVDFKRRYYGYDVVYPKEFVCPEIVEGLAAPTLRAGAPAEAGMKDDAVETIDSACEAWTRDVGVGFSLCVARHGVIVLNHAYGTRGVGPDKDKAFTPETRGPLASTLKFFTGILVIEFVDRGAIGLDEPIGLYMPPLRNLVSEAGGRPLTARDCYVHIGGFNAISAAGDRNSDVEEMVADLYPALEVGARHEYDGTGLALGAKLLEMISGQSLPCLYRRHLIEPLGCADTDCFIPTGGGVSTSLDLARIGQMCLNGGSYGDMRFFHPETLRAMMPVPGRDRFEPDVNIRWGVGIKQFDIDGLSDQAFGHPGASGSFLVVDPKYDLVVSMIRFDEGSDFPDFLKRKSIIFKAILDSIKE
jgi:CubicO group peptidase (beta-lactamase class C family)